MRIEIILDGEVYRSRSNDDGTAEEASQLTYEAFKTNDCNSLRLYLKKGGIIVLGPDAVKKAAIVFYDD